MGKDEAVFSISCPYLRRTITLKKETWLYKIIPAHQEVENRLDLISEILSRDDPTVKKYRQRGEPDRIALFKECPHLLPHNKYIKIAVRLTSNDEGVVTTVHGKRRLPSNMEEM